MNYLLMNPDFHLCVEDLKTDFKASDKKYLDDKA